MAVTTAVQDLFHSVYEMLASIFGTVYAVVAGVLSAILNFFTGIFTLVTDVFSGVIDVVGGVGKFLLGNIVILAVLAAGGMLYVRYTNDQKGIQNGKPMKPISAVKKNT